MTSHPLEQTRVLLHIGYHKTGSSWLQRELFKMPRSWLSASTDPKSMSSGGFTAPWSRRDIARWLVWDHPLAFDPGPARDIFAQGLSAVRESFIPVISHERLSGLPAIGGYDSKEIADRLVRVFPSARVLMVVREQGSMLVSLWKGYVQRGGIKSLNRFVLQQRRSGSLGSLGRHLEYDRLIAYYHSLFGPENVLVMPFERLARQPDSFIVEVEHFAQARQALGRINCTSENRSLSPAAVAVKRFLNLVAIPLDIDMFPQSRLNDTFLSIVRTADRTVIDQLTTSRPQRMERAVSSLLGDVYAASNRRTSELTGIDLRSHGYAC